MTAVSVYLRSHCWDAAVAHCLGAASEALGAPVTLAADLTQPFALPGFRLAALEDLVTGPMHMTFLKPIGLSELPGVEGLLVHPLLTGARLGQKLVASVAEIARDDPARQMQLLRRALRRPIDPAARRVLRAAVATASRPR